MARIKNVHGEAFKAQVALDMIFPPATPGRVRARGENHGWLTENKDRIWGFQTVRNGKKLSNCRVTPYWMRGAVGGLGRRPGNRRSPWPGTRR